QHPDLEQRLVVGLRGIHLPPRGALRRVSVTMGPTIARLVLTASLGEKDGLFGRSAGAGDLVGHDMPGRGRREAHV
ncbi:MAG: hypothetical protein DIU78_017860, partial [Pseudomonadota bacterium]